jgi:tRNA(Ile)-lysidine synthase
VATLDADKVQFPLTVRLVQHGDRFVPFGMKGSKLVSDYMTDQKFSILEKRHQEVVTDATGAIVWLIGRRTDNRFRVSKETTNVLRITITF